MTYDTGSAVPPGSAGSSTASTTPTGQPSAKDVAKDQAAQVSQTAQQAGGRVAATATDSAKSVASQATHQARDLLGEARGQVTSQAVAQQQRAAGGLRTIAQDLQGMAGAGGSGITTEVARQAATRVDSLAGWIEAREPQDIIEEVRMFARRKPAAFLLGAAVAGVVAGRLTKGATAAGSGSSRESARIGGSGRPSGTSSYTDVTSSTGVASAPATGFDATGGYAAPGQDYTTSGGYTTAQGPSASGRRNPLDDTRQGFAAEADPAEVGYSSGGGLAAEFGSQGSGR